MQIRRTSNKFLLILFVGFFVSSCQSKARIVTSQTSNKGDTSASRSKFGFLFQSNQELFQNLFLLCKVIFKDKESVTKYFSTYFVTAID